MSGQEWTLSPYAVGLLLDCPDEISPVLSKIYTNAENVRRQCGVHPWMPAGKSVHACYVAHVAANLHIEYGEDESKAELLTWLDRAASILMLDAGLDLEVIAAPVEPPGARQHRKSG